MGKPDIIDFSEGETDDKQSRFEAALKKFRTLVDRGNETTKIFEDAYAKIRTDRVKGIKALDEDYDEKMDKALEPFRIKGRDIDGPDTLYYLGDAVDLYEKRRDDRQGQTALLFKPDCPHIEALRHVINLIKKSELAYPAGSPEYKAATAIEEALNDVQKNSYTSLSAKKDSARLHVTGYNSDIGTKPHGKGIVIREYGDIDERGYSGCAQIEMSCDAVLQHLYETNALIHYANGHNKSPVDITVITDDGKAHGFNYYKVVNGKDECMHADSFLNNHKDLFDFIQQLKKSRHIDADTTLTPQQVDFVAEKVLPIFTKERPSLVDNVRAEKQL